jgi:hypothetical protein
MSKIQELLGALSAGPQPGVSPGPTGDLKAAPRPHTSNGVAPLNSFPGSTPDLMAIFKTVEYCVKGSRGGTSEACVSSLFKGDTVTVGSHFLRFAGLIIQ